MEIIAQRVFSSMYIYLDICFLVFFTLLLIVKKKYPALLFGLAGGLIYMLVDYGIFHLALGSRSIAGGNMFWVLLWLSFSYGITNFAWIWLWLSKDKNVFSWALLIISWWIACPMITEVFGSGMDVIRLQRTTGGYHGYMAILLFAGYAMLAIMNMREGREKIPIPRLLLIGITVQFAWEFSLLVGGIRSAEFADFESKIMTLTVNSLLETNMGMPYLFLIHRAISRKLSKNMV